jgi:multiple sugar transport system substrate-binding protein
MPLRLISIRKNIVSVRLDETSGTDPRGVWHLLLAQVHWWMRNGNAQIPEHWKAAWKVGPMTAGGRDWFSSRNGPYSGADFLQGPGGPVSVSGNMGMIHIHLWYVAPWALGNV